MPDASKLMVKVYPGVMTQVIEGVEGMLRMPGGCFEQTSSSAYPEHPGRRLHQEGPCGLSASC